MPVSDDNIDGHTLTFWIRVDAVVELILKNPNYLHSKRSESLTETVKHQLKVEDRMAKEYIKHAKKHVKLVSSENLKEAKEKAIFDREALLFEVKNDPKLKLEIMKDRDNIKGAYTTKIEQKTTINLKGFDLAKLKEEELAIVEGMVKRGEDPRPYLISKGLFVGNV